MSSSNESSLLENAERTGCTWDDAMLALELVAVDPRSLGGVVLRARHGPARDTACVWARALLGGRVGCTRLPLHATDDRLLGGLDLAETLRTGRPCFEAGFFARANDGLVMVPSAERLSPNVTSHLCSALDHGAVAIEREGASSIVPARFNVVALDESVDGEEGTPAALRDRLAFVLDLEGSDPRARSTRATPRSGEVERARERVLSVTVDDYVLVALSAAAAALGLDSLRATIFAAAAARAHAALEGRLRTELCDAEIAARLVLAPRTKIVPATVASEPNADHAPNGENGEKAGDASESDRSDPRRHRDDTRPLADIVLDAAKSAIPDGVLDDLPSSERVRAPRGTRRLAGRSGTAWLSSEGGRPAGTAPLRDLTERLDLVETLRAAAPWQRLRKARREGTEPRRIEIRMSDLRSRRYQQRAETCVIFCVDASGSLAMKRLAEAKGAVELVLADCYVRRDHVALVSFRGDRASVLLPPTRSLARAKRCLAELAGGGTTPLASGIDAAVGLARDAVRRGRTPIVVLMTDGRGNVGRDGQRAASVASEDAIASAKILRTSSARALFFDTAPRPRPHARELAAHMGARYEPLPYASAARISQEVNLLCRGARA